jgi:flagellar biosynthesis protein FlhA
MAALPSAQAPAKASKLTDLGIAAAILAIVGMLILPMPDWMLDLGIAANLAIAVIVMLVTVYAKEPLEFSVFPSLLLVTTLFRLALNVAATKLILATGQPGHIIEAFGNVVLGGNFVVGVIAFLILMVVQFVVITNGAGRVAEVAARFTLDAMPGKQMAIDGELSNGLIDEAAAKERRKAVEAEADFYGAMDGASKFVKGDAIAAILIVIINIVGGFAIGLVNGNSDPLTILRTYTLLTVGEGLVSQVPALLISTATGLLVTRAGTEGAMGKQFFGQMFGASRPIMLAGALLLGLFLVPGFPKLPLALVGGTALFLSLKIRRNELANETAAVQNEEKARLASVKKDEDPLDALLFDPITIELGRNLIPLANKADGGDLTQRVAAARKSIAHELGIVMPTVRIRDNMALAGNEYSFKLRDQVVAGYTLQPRQLLALDTGAVTQTIDGQRTEEPAFGQPALWIPKTARERAEMCGYLVTDPASVLITHLTEIVRKHAHELLTREATQALIENIKSENKVVVEELIPGLMTLGEVQKVLQNLLRERVSVRDLPGILEALADWAPKTKDIDQLTEVARAALARQICRQNLDEDGTLHVITLPAELEQTLRESVQLTNNGLQLGVDPDTANRLLNNLNHACETVAAQGYNPVLLCSSQIRLPLKRLTERMLPNLTVLAYNEIVPRTDVQVIAAVETAQSLAEMAA